MTEPARKLPLTPPSVVEETEVPQFSSGRILAIDEIENEVVRSVVEHWQSLRGSRRFPAREALTPRALKRLVRHVMLLRVIDGGADYEFRIVGDVQVQAYGTSFFGMKLSDVAREHPKFAEGTKMFYDGVRMGRDPFAYRGWIGRDMPDTRYSYHELAFLPLGQTDDAVDHILIAGVYAARGAGWIE
jgi:hypothetical protein